MPIPSHDDNYTGPTTHHNTKKPSDLETFDKAFEKQYQYETLQENTPKMTTTPMSSSSSSYKTYSHYNDNHKTSNPNTPYGTYHDNALIQQHLDNHHLNTNNNMSLL